MKTRTKAKTHEWWVHSTAVGTGHLMLECKKTGDRATVNDPTREEWKAAFYAPSKPYRWLDESRVVISTSTGITLDVRGLKDAARSAKINAAVAEHVAGWKFVKGKRNGLTSWDRRNHWQERQTAATYIIHDETHNYAGRYGVVMALLEEKHIRFQIERSAEGYSVSLVNQPTITGERLPEVICIALLRANGVEVLT